MISLYKHYELKDAFAMHAFKSDDVVNKTHHYFALILRKCRTGHGICPAIDETKQCTS